VGNDKIGTGEVAVLSPEGTELAISSTAQDTRILLLNGMPIREPIAARGPFVMNTPEEINQAIIDFQSGKMGRLGPQ
jgi:redox-sensitive bicupin YhaK (pirin superfamily)